MANWDLWYKDLGYDEGGGEKAPSVENVGAGEESRADIRDRRLRERFRSMALMREDSTESPKSDGQSRREKRITKRDQMDLEVFHAVKCGDHEKLKELVNKGANVNTIYRDYSKISTKSLLHVCCEKGKLACASIIVENGAALNIRDKWGQSPLMYCMITQYHEIAEMLLAKRPDLVRDVDHFGKSALHCAAESGSLESIKVLLKYGADVCSHDCYGITPVLSALSQRDGTRSDVTASVVQTMIDAGYRLELKDFRCKRTALQMAVLAGNIPAVEILLAAGASVNTMDNGLRTPLTNAIWRFTKRSPGGGPCAVDPDGMVLILLLTQHNADLNMSVESCNPLATCALVDAAEMTQYFLDNGANPDISFEPSGATPLTIATSKNSIATARVLLQWNCRTDQKSHFRRCGLDYSVDALGMAIFLGHLEIARLLILAGCNLQNVAYLKRLNDEDISNSLQQNPAFFDWIQELADNPLSLVQAAVRCIRKVLGCSLESKANVLPVPPRVKNIITLTETLDSMGIFPFVD